MCVCLCLTRVIYKDLSECLASDLWVVPQVWKAHAEPLVKHGFRVAAGPAGLDLLHGGPARVHHHAL